MDSLAEDPERFTRPHNGDTGETILHLLAKEGKVEILEKLIEDQRMEKDMVKGLLFQDKLKWTPVMSATKADSGSKDIIEIFIKFLLEKITDFNDVVKLLEATNSSDDTLFTLLMRSGLEAATGHDFTLARKRLFEILFKHSESGEFSKWFNKLVRQLLVPNSCELTSRSMKELIDLSSEIGMDFSFVLAEQDALGNNMLMELAKNMKDDALREILTNSATTNYVSN